MTYQPTWQELSALPVFQNVDPEALGMLRPEFVHSYPNGEVIIRENEPADGLVIILHGEAQITADGTHLVTRRPGEVIGEQAFIDNTVRSASATARGFVRALVIPGPVAKQLMGDAAFSRNLLRIVSQKLREATAERAFRFRLEQLLFSEFRAHLPEDATQRLLKDGADYGRPRRIDATLLYADIRSFTERSATMAPEAIASELSGYFDTMVETIHRHGGMVDKFIGDAVLAVWGFVSSPVEPAQAALSCAVQMVRSAREMSFGGQPIRIGVGLSAGEVFIGNMGGERRRQFTVLGSPVNLAARYQSETKTLGTSIVIGRSLYERLSADVQVNMKAHPDRPIRGDEHQTLYTYDLE